MSKIETIPVGLGARAYTIEIGRGLLARAADYILPHLSRPKVAIVTDENLARLHLPTLLNSLATADIEADVITLPAGEATKSFTQLDDLCSQLLTLEIERHDIIIALGGGVIGDITGFAAAILRRGCRFIQIPTSLLAQVDSSVGGKTAINTPQGKNLIGAFHQPILVLADIDLLETLPLRELRAGYGEIVKYALLGDADFFDWLEVHGPALLAGDKQARKEAVCRSVQAKAHIVEEDEKEQGARALLNLGHTFGHALEALSGYSSKLLHGEAVALGCVLAFEFSAALNLCSPTAVNKVRTHFEKVGLAVKISEIEGLSGMAEQMLTAIYQDKKVSANRLVFILVRDIGKAFIAKDIAPTTLRAFLEQKCTVPNATSSTMEEIS